MEISGRLPEKKILKSALRSRRSELIAVYGRRRIGKTYLIREFYSKDLVFSMTGLSAGEREDQLINFMDNLEKYTARFKDQKPANWLEAFVILRKHISANRKTKKKKVIFIDEFPWLDTERSGFLPAFENFWNDFCAARQDLVVVVCGSAASYIVKKLVKNKRGLNRRITRTINLEPFTLGETKAFFKQKNITMTDKDLLSLYMVLGGIPEYLEQVEKGESVVSIIDRLCFKKRAHLEDEFEVVFESLFENSTYHKLIMEALAKARKKGLTRNNLLSACKVQTSGRFSQALKDLELSGFILKYTSYYGNTKQTLFRIYDEYCLFYLQFIRKYKGNSWQQLYQKQAYRVWCGYSYETICLKHCKQIKSALQIAGVSSKNYSWSNEDTQVDLVIDRDDNWVNLCEIKFHDEAFQISAAQARNMETKISEFKKMQVKKKNIVLTMITTAGLQSNKYSTALVSQELGIASLLS